MIRFFVRRSLQAVPTLAGISLLAFGLVRLIPGDPVRTLLGERGGSPEVYAELKAKLGLDKTLTEQYMLYIYNCLRGDLGESIISKQPVWDEFKARLPATLELSLCSLFLAMVIGIPCGVWAAVRKNSMLDYILMGFSLVGYSMPIFWWGLILIMFFSVQLGWTPVSGRIGVAYDFPMVTGFLLIDSWLQGDGWPAFKDTLSHLLLPAVALGTIPMAVIARMTRASMLEVLTQDYIRTAHAKGLGVAKVVFNHALRNALVPIVTVIGLMAGTLVTGAILTETIFSWPGIGKWIVSSVAARDYPVIQGGILVISVLVIAVNALVDVAYTVVNPRMRNGQS